MVAGLSTKLPEELMLLERPKTASDDGHVYIHRTIQNSSHGTRNVAVRLWN